MARVSLPMSRRYTGENNRCSHTTVHIFESYTANAISRFKITLEEKTTEPVNRPSLFDCGELSLQS